MINPDQPGMDFSVSFQRSYTLQGNALSGSDSTDIAALAEGCIVDDGPAIYIAQVIVSWLGMQYTRATGCSPVTPRSSRVASTGKLELFPNPATSEIFLKNNSDVQILSIHDAYGRFVRSVEVSQGDKFGVADLQPGIYFVITDDDAIKFVKH